MLQRTNISVIRYHAYKVKVPVGTQVTFRKDVTVPSYEKILAKHGERTIGSVGVPLNALLYRAWSDLTVVG